MNEFILPAVVEPDPEANVTDLLLDRRRRDPRLRRSSRCPPPTAAGRTHASPSSTARWSPSPRASSPPASSPARRSASCARPATSGRSSTSRPGSPVPCSCRSTRPRSPAQIHYNLDRLGRDRDHRRDAPTTSPASTRCAATSRRSPRSGRSASATSTSSSPAAPASPTRRSRRAAPRRRAPTSRPSSTPRARPGVPKGCILTHSNFVELTRNAAVAMKEVVAPGVVDPALHHDRARLRALHLGARRARRREDRPPGRHQAAAAVARSFKPTFLLAVPRVFEKVYNSAEQKAEAGGKGKIFRAAADVAVAHSKALDAGKVPLGPRRSSSRCSTGSSTASSGPRWAATSSTRSPDRRRSACASATSSAASASRSSRATA